MYPPRNSRTSSRGPDIILGSASPRRREILTAAGASFEVLEPEGIDEDAVRGAPDEVTAALARAKAERVLECLRRSRGGDPARWLVIGADTVVAAREGDREVVLGKPRDDDDARRMLRLLSGATHRVVTAVAVTRQGFGTRVERASTEVTFRRLSPSDVEAYVATGDHRGKAGAYGIQSEGGKLVAGFRGCYHNVVGLPAALAIEMCRNVGGACAAFTCDCARHPLQIDRSLAYPCCAAPGLHPALRP